jgi:hypothetical protein
MKVNVWIVPRVSTKRTRVKLHATIVKKGVINPKLDWLIVCLVCPVNTKTLPEQPVVKNAVWGNTRKRLKPRKSAKYVLLVKPRLAKDLLPAIHAVLANLVLQTMVFVTCAQQVGKEVIPTLMLPNACIVKKVKQQQNRVLLLAVVAI